MKIAICDDDKAIRDYIVSLIRDILHNADISEFQSGEEMCSANENFDISFLDIKLQNMSGIDVAKHIRNAQDKYCKTKSIIIFITGYSEYVEEAFDINAFHYLLKPIDEKKFKTVFNRAVKEIYSTEVYQQKYVIVKRNNVQKKILFKDIYYIESSNKKVIFHTKDGILDIYGKMDEWQEELGNSFYRCHRGYLVNMEKITAYSYDTIEVINGDSLILAQKKYPEFIKVYMRYAKNGGTVNV